MKPDYDMSTGGWTKAEIYANVGSGGWGAIDFDFSEYSDYKMKQTNSPSRKTQFMRATR
ncbi:MAG: hypothetical protein ACLR56_01585 [Oscillospiraceae bacterium]